MSNVFQVAPKVSDKKDEAIEKSKWMDVLILEYTWIYMHPWIHGSMHSYKRPYTLYGGGLVVSII